MLWIELDITLFQFDYFCYEPIFHLATVSIIVNVYAIFEGIANYSLKNFNFVIETYRSKYISLKYSSSLKTVTKSI